MRAVGARARDAPIRNATTGEAGSREIPGHGGPPRAHPPSEMSEATFLLGQRYDLAAAVENARWRLDTGSIMWLTYRRDFAPMRPYKYDSDAGWGCMLRASQMMMVQVRNNQQPGARSCFTGVPPFVVTLIVTAAATSHSRVSKSLGFPI